MFCNNIVLIKSKNLLICTYKYEQGLSSSAYQRSSDQPVLKHLSAVQNVQHTPILPHPSPPDVEPDKKPTLTELPPSPDLGKHAVCCVV